MMIASPTTSSGTCKTVRPLAGSIEDATAAPVLARHGGIYADGRPKLSEYVDYIFCDELAKVATGGLFASLFTYGIALPPIVATLSKSHPRGGCPRESRHRAHQDSPTRLRQRVCSDASAPMHLLRPVKMWTFVQKL